MTEHEIHIIKKTWRIFRAIDPRLVGDLFYSKLFADTPGLRRMFPKDMTEQYNKLVGMLNMVIARIDKLETLRDEIGAMAQRHVQYGVRPAHYKLVGKALLWTLQQGLGVDWTKEAENAWRECYATMANAMISGATGYSRLATSHPLHTSA